MDDSERGLLALTSRIVAAYLAKNVAPPESIPGLIRSVHASLASAGTPMQAIPPAAIPAVAPKKSVHPDFIICLEDGKKLKMLKRHLRTAYNLSPEEYRAKWGLPPDYPMVAPSYSAKRSGFAREIGLGRRPGNEAARRAKP